MSDTTRRRRIGWTVTAALTAGLIGACAGYNPRPYTTQRDKTVKGAGIGAAAGAVGALAKGKREGDEILAGAAIGALLGGGIGAYMDHLEERLARSPGTRVERLGRDTLMIRFESDVLFAVDSASVAPAARGQLGQVAQVLNDFRKTSAVVHGHTDSTGTEVYNQRLSERRAVAVRNVLISRGVEAGRITAVGSGESAPVADNTTSWGRQQNRRVEVVLRARAV